MHLKILILTFRALQGQAPPYISDLIQQHSLMKMCIYTTNVISRGIYAKNVFCVYMLRTKKPWGRFSGEGWRVRAYYTPKSAYHMHTKKRVGLTYRKTVLAYKWHEKWHSCYTYELRTSSRSLRSTGQRVAPFTHFKTIGGPFISSCCTQVVERFASFHTLLGLCGKL